MSAVLLDSKTGEVTRRPARDLVVATRMPPPPKEGTYRSPFDAEGDVVVECDQPGCGWGASGPRDQVGGAVRQHHRLFHSDETSVVLLNHARQ